jgi:hypothetical protein
MVGHFFPGGPGYQENITIGEETVFLQEEAYLDFGGGTRHGGGDPLPPEMLKTLNPRSHDQVVDGVLENLEKDPQVRGALQSCLDDALVGGSEIGLATRHSFRVAQTWTDHYLYIEGFPEEKPPLDAKQIIAQIQARGHDGEPHSFIGHASSIAGVGQALRLARLAVSFMTQLSRSIGRRRASAFFLTFRRFGNSQNVQVSTEFPLPAKFRS